MNEAKPNGMARVLIIDDEPLVRDMLRYTLESVGHTVVEASDGRVAMRLWRENPADLIVTDLLMPEKDGLEVIRELRRDFPQAKIIALSGGSRRIDFDTLDIAKRFGAVHALAKPFELRVLLDMVNSLIDGGTSSASPR
ncbi:MAG: response regulator [Nitrospiraceae bacterium]